MFPRRAYARVALPILAAASAVTMAQASSHREAPGISVDPVADNTDTYFFVSPTNPDNVVLVGCWWPIEEPSGGPNWFSFADDVDYVFHVDNDGSATEDLTFVFRFKTQIWNPNTFLYATNTIDSLEDPDWNYRQTYDVLRVEGVLGETTTIAENLIVPPVNIGPRTTPNYEALVEDSFYELDNGIKVFAGQRDDPFFVDLGAVFDLLGFRAIPGNQGQGLDDLSGYNCQAIAIEVPIEMLTNDGSNPKDPADQAAVLGLWATSRRMTPLGSPWAGYRQVSRLGMPLVNEVVIPLGQKDRFNASRPIDDPQFLNFVLNPELAGIIQALYGITVPTGPRCDLAAVFLTGVPGLNQPPAVVPGEMIRVNTAIKPDETNSRFGVLAGDLDGFPNGRRLFDDVVDIEERAVAGVLYGAFCDPSFTPHPLAGQLGDGVDQNDLAFRSEFPYLATPHQGWDHDHHRIEPPHPPELTGPVRSMSELLAGGTTSVETATDASFELGASFPNPASVGTQIDFDLPRATSVSLSVFDVAGRRVRSLVDGNLEAGSHEVSWDGKDDAGRTVGNGIYLYRLDTPDASAQRKLVVLRNS